MDYYLLARVFRVYDAKSGKINGPTKNVIIYAGNEHIKTYIKALTDSSSVTALFTSVFSVGVTVAAPAVSTAAAPAAPVAAPAACLDLTGFAETLAWNNNPVVSV